MPSALAIEDRRRLEHIVKSARDARAIVNDRDASQVAADMIRCRALVNCFTEIGEAAARLTPDARSRLPDVPWRQVVGMRNIVVHVSWEIDVTELVKTASVDLPPLIHAISTVLGSAPPAPDR